MRQKGAARAIDGEPEQNLVSMMNIAQPDLTLILDLEGVIRRATSSQAVGEDGVADWVGRPWSDTVGGVAGDKVRRMVADARHGGVSAFRQINQRFPSGRELPMEFTTVRLGERDGMIAIGRNLQAVSELQSRLIAAQQAREQDYWKLRAVETRYRLLFDATHEAVLVLTVEGLRVVEANPEAMRALGFTPGWEFTREVAQADLDAFQAMLLRVREYGRTPGIVVHLGPNRTPWVTRATLMVSEPGPVFLLQLAPTMPALADAVRAEPVPVDTLLERLPDGFVAIDPDGTIRRANGAFLDLVQVGAEGTVVGQSLGRWLGMPGADLSALLAGVQRHRTVRLFATRIQGELGLETEVEVAAAGNTDTRPRVLGVVIRDTGRRVPSGLDDPQKVEPPLASTIAAMSGKVGHTPLLQLVREATSAVERHYIEEALEQAGGNRTAAAEILGLSRQSLYVKLNRYAMDGASLAAAAAEQGD
jgi:transcriptional regulator PpsR